MSSEPLKLGNDYIVHTLHKHTSCVAALAPTSPPIEKGFVGKRRGKRKGRKTVVPLLGGTVFN